MRSSSGQHFAALDHIRPLAAFMVFSWHFLHFTTGTPVPFEGAPAVFPLALFDEGHTGVALFMVLSGYLFAKLLAGRKVSYLRFFWNRVIRLAPLLMLVFALVVLESHLNGNEVAGIARNLYTGFILPTWPNGGWSIATELHFYALLPALLFLVRRSRLLPLVVVLSAMTYRACHYFASGEVQSLAYWTIVGRIDQFTLGIMAFYYSSEIKQHAKLVLALAVAFSAFYWWFDLVGGFYRNGGYPSTSALWIWLPTLEGVAYGSFVAWYDQSPRLHSFVASGLLQKLGEYSYSIYLLHFFVVFKAAHYVHTYVMDISGFYSSLAWAAIFFVAMVVPGHLSYRYIESPFLRLRRNYIRTDTQPDGPMRLTAMSPRRSAFNRER